MINMVALVRPYTLGGGRRVVGPLDSPDIWEVKVPENGEPGQIVRMLKLCVCECVCFCDMRLPSQKMMRTSFFVCCLFF